MATTGKNELIRVASKKTDLNVAHMKVAYECFMEAIREEITAGNIVLLDGIGRLIPTIKPGGMGRNPRTGKVSEYGPRMLLKFKVNANFKLALRDVELPDDEEDEDDTPTKAPAKKESKKAPAKPAKSGKAKTSRR